MSRSNFSLLTPQPTLRKAQEDSRLNHRERRAPNIGRGMLREPAASRRSTPAENTPFNLHGAGDRRERKKGGGNASQFVQHRPVNRRRPAGGKAAEGERKSSKENIMLDSRAFVQILLSDSGKSALESRQKETLKKKRRTPGRRHRSSICPPNKEKKGLSAKSLLRRASLLFSSRGLAAR